MRFSKFASAALALFLTTVGLLGANKRPNIVVIFADDLGINDISAYGKEIKTPHIDSIGRKGVKLEQYYAASSICTPSRFGLLTGHYPNRSQDKLLGALMFLEERDDHRGLRKHETTIASVLKTNGYRTALIGKWHLGHGEKEFLPNNHGFDYSYGSQGGCVDYFTQKYGYKPDWFRNGKPLQEKGYSTDLITADTLRFLETQNDDKPFFLFLSYTAPHYGKGWDPVAKKTSNPLQAKPKDRARFPEIKDTNRLEYAAMVAAMDDGVGQVLEALKKRKLLDNTLVIFTSDNGGDPKYAGNNDPFRGRKAQLFEGGIHVPCLIQWPKKLKPGTIIKEPITALDFFPTFCGLAGVSSTSFPLDGNDMMPMLIAGKKQERDLFWKLANFDALRRGDWKFVRDTKEEYLFNLAADPFESKNLAQEKPELLKELKAAHDLVAATFSPAKR